MSNFLKKDVNGMPSSSRPRGMSGAGSGGSGRPAVTAPMSERQQMALLMQMTSNSGTNDAEMSPGGNTGPAHSRTTRDRINERGETALHIASKKGDQDAVKKLLEQGANPNVTDFAGWTPLHEACNHGHYNVALALVKAGANINATGLENDTPLHDAAITGQLKLVKMLVERGADPTFKNQKGKAPCDVAAAAVYNYLLQARDNAIGRHAHLRKSSADTSSGGGTGAVGRKAHGSVASNNNSQQGNLHTIDVEEASSRMGGSGALTSIRGKDKEEDDIYEFKSTPKDSSSSSSDEKEGSNGASGGTNRKGDKSGEEKQSAGAHHGSVPPHLVHQDLGGRAGQTHVDGHSHHQASKDHDVKHPQIIGQLNASGGLTVGSNGGREIGTIGGSGGIAYVTKRPYSEMVDGGDDIGPPNEDETRRKRRKDVDPLGGIKEASVGPVPLTKSGVGNRGGTPRQEKGAKASGGTPSAKNLGLSAKNALDRKSPCASPKLSGNSSTGVIVGSGDRNTVAGGASGAVAGSIASSGGGGGSSSSSSGKGSSGTSSSNDSDVENGAGVAGGADDGLGGGKGGEPGFGGVSGGGPKVPPLKIVIPQQSAGGDADTVGTTRNGKNVSTRNHPALPYVVASSNSNESTADKESTSSRSASPADSKSSDEKNPSQASKDERTQQRVLRSSHRGGGGNSNSSLKDGSMDRSNNSSPQMQQQSCGSPSSLSNSGCDTSEKGSSKEASGTSQGSSGNRSNTPNAPGGGGVGEAESGGGTGGASGPNPKSPVVGSASSAGTGSGDGSASGGTGGSNASSSSGGNGGSAGNGSAASASGNASASASEKTQGTSSNSSSSSTSSSSSATSETSVHPRKRKIKTNKEQASSGGAAGSSTASGSNATAAGAAGGNAASSSASTSAGSGSGNAASGAAGTAGEDKKDAREETADVHPHDQPITNCYQMYLKIRKQIESRQKGLFPVQPKPPQGFKDYLMNRCTYVLAGKAPPEPNIQVPASLPPALKDLFQTQEKERHKLKMQHIVEKEKLVLAVEQEILRVHGRAARALANQSLPFSVCTILKDEEVYNIITPEQEEKDRNARSRYNGRLFLSWLQDVDDKWEKIKEAMLLRHHNEAESLHAVQRMDWEFNMKEHALCEFKAKPVIDDTYVPMVNVNDDFDLLPA